MTKTYFLRNILVVIEILVLVLILFRIYTNYKGGNVVLGTTTVVPLDKNYYVASPSAKLKHYYEPLPNKKELDFQPSWLPYQASYTFNSDTLNERYDYNVVKPEEVYRIITLGDSFTFGQYVNTVDNWTELLEDKLNLLRCDNISAFEVINLGMGGYGPEYIKERYKTRGIKYKPDLVIWNESGDDFERVNELFMEALKKYESELTSEEKNSFLNKGEYPWWWRAVYEVQGKYSNDELRQMVKDSWLEFFKIRGRTRVLVATFKYLEDEKKKLLINWINGQDNVEPYFELPDLKSQGMVLQDGHPNKEGHKAIAESISDYLKQNILTDCH